MDLDAFLGMAFTCFFPALFIGIALLVGWTTRQRTLAGWTALSQRAGLTLEPGGLLQLPSASGVFQGRTARLWFDGRNISQDTVRHKYSGA